MDIGTLQEQIFSAIDTITEEKMKNQSFNYCIEGVIDSDSQNADGSYNFLYQDASLTAFSLGNTKYHKGDIVYVMAISGDLNRKKVILTAKSKSGEQYIDVAEEIARVSKVGINYVTNVENEFVLYSGTSEKDLLISSDLVPDSMTQTFIRLSVDLESKLEPTQGANYGMKIGLKFEDDIVKEYALSMNEVLGDVYNNKGRQYTIEKLYLDSIVKEVVYAKLFITGFPESHPTEFVKFQRVRIDFVDSSVADIAKQVTYKVEIFSTNGLVFKNGVGSTTLLARVYQGSEDITDRVDASRFHWSRTNADGTTETDWRVGPSISVDHNSVNSRATFTCEISDSE